MKQYTPQELDNIRKAGEILSMALLKCSQAIKPGISTLDIDKVATDYILSQGAQCCFADYRDYGFATCTSVNQEIVHGKPRADKILSEGDIVKVDVGVRWNGFCADAARTFAVGEVSPEAKKLMDVTKESFWAAVKGLKAGKTISVIGAAVEDYVKGHSNYGILETYFGHGIGRSVHEEPLIPNYRPKIQKLRAIVRQVLLENTAICIEPMIALGSPEVKVADDKWTVIMSDGKLSAHYENTVIVLKDGVEVVTSKYI
jgi:methionyl aminopeptidase